MSKRRKIIISSDQEKLLEDFYDQLDDTFLGNSFEDEDNLPVVVIAPELSSDDDEIMMMSLMNLNLMLIM